MENFIYHSPTKFIFGKDTECTVAEQIHALGGTRVLVHYGSASAVRSGLLDRILSCLDAAGLPHIELGGVKPNPRDSLVYKGIALGRKENIDFILAVGGGSVIDSSKAIGLGLAYEGDFWDFYSQKAVPKATIPVGSVLTIAAAGSESSNAAVITQEKTMLKRALNYEILRPRFAILNPELTYTLPPYQTASGAVDIMAHILERYISDTTGVEFTDRLCEGTVLTVMSELPKVLKNPFDYDGRANLMFAAALSHNNIFGVGRVQDWASHKMEHELSGLYDVAHGAGLAVMMPAWMLNVYQHNLDRFCQFAVRVFGKSPSEDKDTLAKAGIEELRSFFRSVGMPVSFREIGAKREDIPLLVEKTLTGTGGTVGSFVPLNAALLTKCFETAANFDHE
ncbi:MAG: iron-containing alcohol dehydrogenase [Lachnospiraceae bacterium]|jgi:alcohol dehydrogenase YqhD (iron-dependent ADH family)|nr:iron-containing alcohol dehydrogenase [Lachnospiraceae bacterium]